MSLSERVVRGYGTTDELLFNERRVVPGLPLLPHLSLWADSSEIPYHVNDVLLKKVNSHYEAESSGDGQSFGADGHGSAGGVVTKRVRKQLVLTGSIGDMNSYEWDLSLGPAIPQGACDNADFIVEHIRSDSRLEVVRDFDISLDPRGKAVLVNARYAEPLFATFYSYTGSIGLANEKASEIVPEPEPLAKDTFGLHHGDVVGNLRGYVSSIDNLRTITGTLIGEVHGHVGGTFEGDATGTFTGEVYISRGVISHLESLGIGTAADAAEPLAILAEASHITMRNSAGDACVVEFKNEEFRVNKPVNATAANIGALSCESIECSSITSYLGIKNSYAGMREIGAVTGISDCEIENGLFFGNQRFVAAEGSFRIVRAANDTGVLELVVQEPDANGIWTTVRPVGALGATTLGTASATIAVPSLLRAAPARSDAMYPNERVGQLVTSATGTFVSASAGNVSVTSLGDLANTVLFPTSSTEEIAAIVVDLQTAPAPAKKVWRGELTVRRGALVKYGATPFGSSAASRFLSSSACVSGTTDVALETYLPDAQRHIRQVVFLSGDGIFTPKNDSFLQPIGNGAFVAKGPRGPLKTTIQSSLILNAAPLLNIGSTVIKPNTRTNIEIVNAVVGATFVVVIDGVQMVDTTLTNGWSSYSLGSVFARFQERPRRVRATVTHPTAIPALLQVDMYSATSITALTNYNTTSTVNVAYSWSQVPNAEDAILNFDTGLQMIHIPNGALFGNSVAVDTMLPDGSFLEDTQSYASNDNFAGHITLEYTPGRRGACKIRVRSLV